MTFSSFFGMLAVTMLLMWPGYWRLPREYPQRNTAWMLKWLVLTPIAFLAAKFLIVISTPTVGDFPMPPPIAVLGALALAEAISQWCFETLWTVRAKYAQH